MTIFIVWVITNIISSLVVLSIGIIFLQMTISGYGKKPEMVLGTVFLILGGLSLTGAMWIGVNFWAGS